MKRTFSLFLFALVSLMTTKTFASTWYVRPDGGTRYSANMTSGQCNGKADAPYSGVGVNQNCAFKDARYFWQDGSYTTSNNNFPAYGWVGAGGDTYLIRGSIGGGVSYRVGWNNPSNAYDDASGQRWGIQGDPYDSGPPVPPSGTASQHTRILGENYASCSAPNAKTQWHGGFGVGTVLNMAGASYVDVACLDITDYSSCELQGSSDCNKNPGSLSDYAGTGIFWNRTSTNDTLTDVHVHGLASNGMQGPTGTGMVFTRLDLIGNASSGWNADNGDGTTGTGTLLVQNFNISWNGCVEEYPIVDALPYTNCRDDSSQGYGDGFGTATVASSPAWNAVFDQGITSYNTQDGLDALHLIGNGSSMTITRVLAYGNMGQQIKIGGANGTAQNNVIVTNCNALRQSIPGTPSGYNTNLSDFCRAADAGIKVDLGQNSITTFTNNTVYSASSTGIDMECGVTGTCDATSKMDYRDNIFIGFMNDAAHGYPDGGSGDYSNPIYDGTGLWPFQYAGSHFSNNITFHAKSNWKCPNAFETNAFCIDPLLTDEAWHLYGYNDATPLSTSPALGAAIAVTNVTADFLGLTRSAASTIGAIQGSGTANSSTGTSSTTTTSTSSGSTSTSTSSSSSSSSSTSTTPSTPTASTVKTTVTTLSLTKGPNALVPLILTATVRAADGSRVSSGTVSIYNSAKTLIITGMLNSNGQVSWIVPKFLSGYTIYGVFNGTKTLLASTSPLLNEATQMAVLYSSK